MEILADAAASVSPLSKTPHRYLSGKLAIQALAERHATRKSVPPACPLKAGRGIQKGIRPPQGGGTGSSSSGLRSSICIVEATTLVL